MPFFSSIKAIGPAGSRRLLAKLKAFLDSFARANSGSSIGQDVANWTALSGTWGVNSNRANTSTSASSYPVAVFDAITQDAKVKATGTGTGAGFGVSFWATDQNNWYGAFTEKSTFNAVPYNCNPGHSGGGNSSTCSYPGSAYNYNYNYGCCTGGGAWHNHDSWALCCAGCPNQSGSFCSEPCSNVTCSVTGTGYNCPSGGSLSGSTCSYAGSLTAWYRHQFKVVKKASGTLSTLATIQLGNVTASGTNIDSIEANTSGDTATLTAYFSNGTNASTTINVSTPPKSSKFGMMYGPATMNQITEIETFEYSPN
jgi:hypothetical protein